MSMKSLLFILLSSTLSSLALANNPEFGPTTLVVAPSPVWTTATSPELSDDCIPFNNVENLNDCMNSCVGGGICLENGPNSWTCECRNNDVLLAAVKRGVCKPGRYANAADCDAHCQYGVCQTTKYDSWCRNCPGDGHPPHVKQGVCKPGQYANAADCDAHCQNGVCQTTKYDSWCRDCPGDGHPLHAKL